jgi:hypothetical protein
MVSDDADRLHTWEQDEMEQGQRTANFFRFSEDPAWSAVEHDLPYEQARKAGTFPFGEW